MPEISFTGRNINSIVANYFEIDIAVLCGKEDCREINEARDLLIYFLHKKTDFNLREIGKIMGGRKKHSIHYALRRVKNRMDVYPEIKDRIKEIDMQLKKAV